MKLFNKLLSIFCFIFFSSSLFAIEQQPLVIVMGADSYPYQFVDDQGEPQGLLVELWRDWSMHTGNEIEFIAHPWTVGLDELAMGNVSAHIGMAVTPERLKHFDFAVPISTVNTYLYVNHSLIKKRKISDLQPYKIGIVSGSSHEEDLLTIEPGLGFKHYGNRQDLLQGALAGEVLVFAGMEGQLNNNIINRQIVPLFPISNRLLIKQVKLQPAVKKDQSHYVDEINSGFSQLTKTRIREIESRWLGIEQEQGGMRIAATLEIEPFVSVGVDGHPHGLYVDIWDLWSEKTGIPIIFATGNMNSTIDFVRQGKADVHIGYPESDSLKTGLQRDQLLYRVKSRLFSFKDPISSFNELTHTLIGAVPTAPYLDKLKEILPHVTLKLYDSVDAMIEAAKAGDISSFVASSAWTQHYLVQRGVASDFHQFMDLEFDTDIYVLSAGENSELSKRIKQGFALISREELAEVEQKWMLDSHNRIFSDEIHSIDVTAHESEFLNILPSLKVGYQKSWKPMEFTDSTGKFAGVNSEFFELLQDQLGVHIEAIEYQEWQGLITALIEGEVDIVGSVAFTSERAKTMMFSDPYWPSPWALATPIEQQSIFNIQQLGGKRVAIVEGYQIINELLGPEYGIELVLVGDTQAGLKAVTDGLADAFIEKVINMAFQLKQSQMNQLKMSVLADFAEQQSHFAVNPDKAELVPLINKVINSLDQSMLQEIYGNWVVPSTVEISKRRYQWSNGFALLFCLLVILLILCKLLLGREVVKRKQLERQLQSLTHYDPVTSLPHRTLLDDRLEQAILLHSRELSTFAVLFVGIDGIKSNNLQWGHQSSEELIKKLALALTKSVRRSDTVARFSNEEFVVVLNRTKYLDIVCQVAENIISHLSDESGVDQITVRINTSIGIARYPMDGDSAAELLNVADELMLRAKESGGNCYKSA